MDFISVEGLLLRLDKYKHTQLHIHHTWKPHHGNFTGSNYMSLQQGMKNYHINSNGWSDIGQHITIFPDGKIMTGRDFGRNPASIKGWNRNAFAVEMLGDFDVGRDVLKGAQRDAMVSIIRYFIEHHGQSSIKFHREGPGVVKSCPGSGLNKTELIREAITPVVKEGVSRVKKLKVKVHNKDMLVDGIYEEQTNYIPIRFLEELGYKVDWDQANQTVLVEYKK